MDFIKFKVNVPAADGDVVQRHVKVTGVGSTPQEFTVPGKSAGSTPEFEVVQNTEVTVECINIDDAGNESDPRVQQFIISDTVPPAAPGEMSIEVTGERTE